jgi:hypothetical protein
MPRPVAILLKRHADASLTDMDGKVRPTSQRERERESWVPWPSY